MAANDKRDGGVRSSEQAASIRRLAAARVLVVGVGGLGSAATLALAGAGVGTLTLIDPDAVELSNLHRQLLHRTSAIGTSKVASARKRLAALYPRVMVETSVARFDSGNAEDLIHATDFIIDGTDCGETKFLINDTAVRLGRPFSHAGVIGFRGQTMTVVPGRSACLRCLFPTPPQEATATCRDAGIAGAMAGVIGSLQAAEAVKVITGTGIPRINQILTYRALPPRWRTVAVVRRADCLACASEVPRRPMLTRECA